MKERQYTRKRINRLKRLPIVSELYLRHKSVSQIRIEVMRRLGLDRLADNTVRADIRYLLEEWRQERIKDTDLLVERELKEIAATCEELYSQWEKSKQDYERMTRTRNGRPVTGQQSNAQPGRIRTTATRESTTNIVGLGDPRYIAEIRAQLQERRKLLGLYAPEKKTVTGNMSFAHFLMESGVIDDEPDAYANTGLSGVDADDETE